MRTFTARDMFFIVFLIIVVGISVRNPLAVTTLVTTFFNSITAVVAQFTHPVGPSQPGPTYHYKVSEQ